MKILLFVLAVTLCPFAAFAEGPQLFKDFSFGQPRAEIAKIKGMVPCNDLKKGALCRDKQSFAGNDKWGQGFVFDGDALSMVILKTRFDEKRLVQTMGTVANNGYSVVVLRSGTESCDVLNVIHSLSADAVDSRVGEFEAAALNGSDNLTYTLASNDTIKQCGKTSTSYAELIKCAPENMRAVEIDISGDTLFVRFLAPKAARANMQKLADEQKENF